MYSLYITPPLPACIMYDCREVHGVIIGNTQSVSISFLFPFFFHQSSLYPIKIFVKCFYLVVYIVCISSISNYTCMLLACIALVPGLCTLVLSFLMRGLSVEIHVKEWVKTIFPVLFLYLFCYNVSRNTETTFST